MRVAINMSMSMDGKIATKSRGPVKISSAHDTRRMAEIRAAHDAVLNGAGTFRAHPEPLSVAPADLVEARRAAGKPPQPVSAIVSSGLEIPRGTAWERAGDVERWVFCGREAASSKTADELRRAGVRVLPAAAERPEAREIFAAFRAEGVNALLLEGGGELNASFLEAGLVDEVYLTFVPVLMGGADSLTWCEGVGFPTGAFPRFTLAECERVGDELYLVYRRAGLA